MLDRDLEEKLKSEAEEVCRGEATNHYNSEPNLLTTTRGQTPIHLPLGGFETAGLIEGVINVTKVHRWRVSSAEDWELGILSEAAVTDMLYPLKFQTSRHLGEKLKGRAMDFKLWIDGKSTRFGVKATTQQKVEDFNAITYSIRRLSDYRRLIADYILGASVMFTYDEVPDDILKKLQTGLHWLKLKVAHVGIWGVISRDDLVSYLSNPSLVHPGSGGRGDFVEIPLDAFSWQLLADLQARAKPATYPKLAID